VINLEIKINTKQFEKALATWKKSISFRRSIYHVQYEQLKESGLISPCRYL